MFGLIHLTQSIRHDTRDTEGASGGSPVSGRGVVASGENFLFTDVESLAVKFLLMRDEATAVRVLRSRIRRSRVRECKRNKPPFIIATGIGVDIIMLRSADFWNKYPNYNVGPRQLIDEATSDDTKPEN